MSKRFQHKRTLYVVSDSSIYHPEIKRWQPRFYLTNPSGTNSQIIAICENYHQKETAEKRSIELGKWLLIRYLRGYESVYFEY